MWLPTTLYFAYVTIVTYAIPASELRLDEAATSGNSNNVETSQTKDEIGLL